MDKRFLTFLMLSFAVLSVNMMVMRWLAPPQAQQEQKQAEPVEKTADEKAADELAAQAVVADVDKPGGEKPAEGGAIEQPAAPKTVVPEQRYTLGSLDPKTGYRELVTLLNTGAAVERIELTSQRYLDQEDRSGYIGQLDLTIVPDNRGGALVRVVGPGTPAAEAGLKVNDVITAVNGQAVLGPIEVYDALKTTEPGQSFTLAIERGEVKADGGGDKPAAQELTGTLRRRPMEILRPEALDPPSFLLTLESVDGKKIAKDAKELPGIDMLTANWQSLPQADESEIAFQYDATEFGLTIIKKFRLAKVDPADVEDPSAPAYHLEFSVDVRNTGAAARKVAWRLDGPTGLPLEGVWYATKMSPNWRGGAGMRDVAVGFLVDGRRRTGLVSATTIAEEANPTPWQDEPLEYIGVDAQYFRRGACCPIRNMPPITAARSRFALAKCRGSREVQPHQRLVPLDEQGGHDRARRDVGGKLQDLRRAQTPGAVVAVRSGQPGVLRLVRLRRRADARRAALLLSHHSATTASRSSCSRCWCGR